MLSLLGRHWKQIWRSLEAHLLLHFGGSAGLKVAQAERRLTDTCPGPRLVNKALSRPRCLPGHMAQRDAPPPPRNTCSSQGEGPPCAGPLLLGRPRQPKWTGDWWALPPPCEAPPGALLSVHPVMAHAHDLPSTSRLHWLHKQSQHSPSKTTLQAEVHLRRL